MIITAKGQEHHELLDLMDAVRQIYSDSKIIIVGCLASWVLCRLNFSFVWLLLILACCRTQYGLYIRRVKRVVRDEIYRYEARKALQQGESVEWVNTIVGKLWHLYERRLCDELVRYINAELARKVNVEHNRQKVVIHSLEVIERPLRITKVKTYSKPNTPNFILEAYFLVDIEPIHGHQHLHFLEVPLVDMSIVHERPNRDHHDLSVQVRSSQGRVLCSWNSIFSPCTHTSCNHISRSKKNPKWTAQSARSVTTISRSILHTMLIGATWLSDRYGRD